MKIRVLINNKIHNISIEKIFKEKEKLIGNICGRWIKSFKFDNSIEKADLQQELMLKLYKSLDSYNPELSNLSTYITNIAKNFFISKKLELLSNNGHPVDVDGTITSIRSLHHKLNDKRNTTLLDILDSNEETPEQKVYFKQFLDVVREELNNINYKPKNFTPRLRTFTRVLFDEMFDKRKKFTEAILFDYRCRIRYSKRKRLKNPNKAIFVAESVSKYFGVNMRSINLANKFIKQTIKKCSEEIIK